MNKKFKIITISILSIISVQVCFAGDSGKQKNETVIPNNKTYKVYIPPVFELDSRTSLSRNEINIIDKEKFNNLSKYKRLFYKEINTIGLKYTSAWVTRLKDVADEIKKYPNTIVILEGFRKTEMSSKENLELSKKHSLFIATILKDLYRVQNTMAVIARGTEKNDELNYNCVIVTLIKDINPSQSIQ